MTHADFILELAEIIRNSQEVDFEKYLESNSLFFTKFPHLEKEYQAFKQERKLDPIYKDETWSALLREIRLWKDLDLSYMYARIMELVQEFKGKLEYFEIQTDYGTYVVPDRITTLNKLLQLSHRLIYDIYPQIEQSINYESSSVKVDQKSITGKIDWNETILNTINQSLVHPISFTNLVPTKEFDTPENTLLLVALFWIKNDAVRLMKYHMPTELSRKELGILQNILVSTETTLANSILRDEQEYAKSLGMLDQKDSKINSLITKTKERFHQGLIKQNSYKMLLDWIHEYVNFNTERFTRGQANYRIDRTKDVDTMYELWILFEFLRYLDTKYALNVTPIVDKKGSFHGFDVKFDSKKIRLKYQESYSGQLHERHTPDYTLEINDDNIPLVLDAKNWRNSKQDAKDRMFVYIADLESRKTRRGVLFFPNNSNLPENNSTPFYEKKIKFAGEDISVFTCVLKPSKNKETQNQNEIVFENLSKLLNELFNYTN